MWVRSPCMCLCPLLRVPQVHDQGVSWVAFSSGGWKREESTFELIQVVSRIHFLVYDGASSWLLAGGCPPTSRGSLQFCAPGPSPWTFHSLTVCFFKPAGESVTPVSSEGILHKVTCSWVGHHITLAVFCWLEAIHKFWLQLPTQRCGLQEVGIRGGYPILVCSPHYSSGEITVLPLSCCITL